MTGMAGGDHQFRFRRFPVYQETRNFIHEIKGMARKKFPREELFGLSSQVFRALDSILLNIAEGADRGTDKDFAHFLNNAHTSLNEVVACLDIALDAEYISESDHSHSLVSAGILASQLTAFRKKLLAHPTK